MAPASELRLAVSEIATTRMLVRTILTTYSVTRGSPSAGNHRLQGLHEQPLLRLEVGDGDVRRKPVLDHLAHTLGAGARERARIGEELQVGLAPAELGELVGERVVVRLL